MDTMVCVLCNGVGYLRCSCGENNLLNFFDLLDKIYHKVVEFNDCVGAFEVIGDYCMENVGCIGVLRESCVDWN